MRIDVVGQSVPAGRARMWERPLAEFTDAGFVVVPIHICRHGRAYNREPCKTTEPIEMAMYSRGPRIYMLGGYRQGKVNGV